MNPSQGDAWYSPLFLQSWILPSVISRYEAYKTSNQYSPLIVMNPNPQWEFISAEMKCIQMPGTAP